LTPNEKEREGYVPNVLYSCGSIEKKFFKNDYIQQLAKTVIALAHAEPTIFVGRGSHLILPRHTILSVQLICSRNRRIARLSNMLGVDEGEAEKRLNIMDDEHHEFFQPADSNDHRR
jgi:hypothetical protein